MKSYSERADATREKIKTYKNKAKVRRKKILISAVSLCSCLLIVLNIVIFYPPTNNPVGGINSDPSGSVDSIYKDSEYYEVIKQLSALRAGSSGGGQAGDTNDAPADNPASSGDIVVGDSSSSGNQFYEETTDNQVAGVTEGDLLKRTNKYIYYLAVQYDYENPPALRVYPIDGLQTEYVAEFTITPQKNNHFYGWNNEMYLSEDGTTVTLVLSTQHEWEENRWRYMEGGTEVINIDVSDLSDIKITKRYCVSGTYVSSRLVNSELLLVTDFAVPYYVNFDDVTQFIPSTGTNGKMSCIPAKNIHCPEKPASAHFTVVSTVDVATLEETGCEAFLSYSGNMYVSKNNIYIAYGYSNVSNLLADIPDDRRGDDYHYVYETKTEISRIEYGSKLEYKGSFTVEGSVKDRFCMDEKDGVLRVVTSPHRYEYSRISNHNSYSITDGASLYCMDIESYEVVGKLENFVPEVDTVQSVRFDGDRVYVCTAVVMTDPVFAIDISDYNNIHFVDTGEIPGYSVALRKFYGDTLLGIGYNGNSWSERDLKIELYKETENSVESAATFSYIDNGYEYNGQYYQYANVSFSAEYKSYFIDAERGLIGLGLTISALDYSNGGRTSVLINRYILLQYDGENLNLLLDIELEDETNYYFYNYFYNYTRAIYVDEIFYLFTQKGLTVAELGV